MARARNLKPSFFTNDLLAEIHPLGRLLFAGLWTQADRAGRLEDRPKRLKAEVLPYDNCNVDRLLNDLQSRGFILRYAVGEHRYIQVLAFTKHQNPHIKEADSTIPAPCNNSAEPEKEGPIEHGASTVLDPEFPERARLIPDSLLLIPDSPSLIPDSLGDAPPSASLRAPHPNPSAEGVAKTPRPPSATAGRTLATWSAYATAYASRYGVEPPRNRTVNAHLAALVERVGSEAAPGVAAHYVRSNRGLYVAAKHATNLLVRDAEGLHTEWATQTHGSDTQARQADRTQATGSVFAKLIAEAERDGTHG